MKTTGITRRIDELGRIVIPKEIRKNMHIKPGELMEIYLSDEESITLKKYSVMNKDQNFINCFIKNLSEKINCKICLTNLNEIIFSTEDTLNSHQLSIDLENIINNKFNNTANKLELSNNYVITKPFEIRPVSPNGDLAGLVILDYENEPTDEQKFIINFSTAFLEDYLEGN